MYHIIVNPIAGHGRTIYHLPVITKLFESYGLPCEAHLTTDIMEGYHLAKRLCSNLNESNCMGIIGVGGDGTFQEIVAGMADAFTENFLENCKDNKKIPVPLGMLPAGSGNDFIMTLGGGKANALASYKKKIETIAKNLVESIANNKTRTIDLITSNGTAFINIGNIGLDARIVQNAHSLKAKYGRKAYIAAVYKSIAQHKSIQLEIEVDGKDFSGKYSLVAVCNGQYYGGGLRIAPAASINDGKITLCLVESTSRLRLMTIFPTILAEKHVNLKIFKMLECENVRITLPSTVEFLCLDGNLYPQEANKTIEFNILPNALDVFV